MPATRLTPGRSLCRAGRALAGRARAGRQPRILHQRSARARALGSYARYAVQPDRRSHRDPRFTRRRRARRNAVVCGDAGRRHSRRPDCSPNERATPPFWFAFRRRLRYSGAPSFTSRRSPQRFPPRCSWRSTAARAGGRLVIAALILLAVPWVWAISPALIVAPLFPVAYLAWRSSGENVRVALLAGIAATVMILGLSQLAAAAPHAGAHGIAPRDRSAVSRGELERVHAEELQQRAGCVAAAFADLDRRWHSCSTRLRASRDCSAASISPRRCCLR